MKINISCFYKFPIIIATFAMCAAYADPAPNPRTSGGVATTSVLTSGASAATSATAARSDGRVVRNVGATTSGTTSATVSGRNATTNLTRAATSRPSVTVSRTAATVPATQNVISGRSATVRQTVSTAGTGVSRAATSRAATTNVVRSAANTATDTSVARSAARSAVVGGARGSMARATAVFDDVSKIGGGYATCREAYATCMDQFCANANDTYRRCFCSARYDEFRNTEDAISEALNMLAQFENNNLAAVNMSAEEVAAMYSATAGENAIKNDTSAASQMLSEISDLLSGNRTTTSSSSNNGSLSLGIIDFSSDLGDIWSGDGSSSLFGESSGVDLSTLEGEELYNQASRQCAALVADSCENDAVRTMAQSAYGILITQDCNTYEKSINSKKESLEQTIRTAEKYLREARLEEYRSHNSADVNECIANVRSAILTDTACGANYEKCLDYTGAYINQSTGEPIYSQRLFQLENLIRLPGVNGTESGNMDVLSSNREFNEFLDSRRMFAESALNSCRDIADTVWTEFKRQALIEIAQAQDAKLEEVRMSCVSTISQCYDTQSGALRDFDTTTSQYSGAVSAVAARAMCEEQVIACASLYGDTNGCSFDGNGKLESGTVTGDAASSRCGLTALLNFVDTVDTVRITEGCAEAVNNYVNNLCTPTSGTYGFPWNCRNKTLGSITNSTEGNGDLDATLAENIVYFAENNCMMGSGADSNLDRLDSELLTQLQQILNNIEGEMDSMLAGICEEQNGYWVSADSGESNYMLQRVGGRDAQRLTSFYTVAYGGNATETWGVCYENSTMVQCLNYNTTYGTNVASYDSVSDRCTFNEQWYQKQCEQVLGGYYENSTCYAPMQ